MPGTETFRASADAYDRFVGRYGPELATALIDFAGVEPGMRTLDVGCGPGALAAVLVERLGAARVSAADPSAPFVDACRARLPGVEVVEAGAEALPFADGAFDAALSQLVVNFMRDGEAGVREMARVTRPGGIVASCVWDYGGEMTLLRAFWDAAREVDPERGAAADEGIVMRWCAEGELADLWRAAGLGQCASARSWRARSTRTSRICGRRCRPELVPPARSASRSRRTTEPRFATLSADVSGR